MPGLQIHLLGSFQVALDGQIITTFGYDKVRALLVYLVTEKQSAHDRDALAGLLWPDQSETAAHDSLRNALAKLRHAIHDQEAQPHYLIATKNTLQFNPSCETWLDVSRLTELLETCRAHRHRRIEACPACTSRLLEAASLYQGKLLYGFSLPDSDLFEDWLRLKREKYQALVLQVFQWLSSTYEWRAEPERALVYAQRQLELDACSEEAHAQLMRLYASLGKRSEACSQYIKCKNTLAEMLGVEPSVETTRLYVQIKYGLFQTISSNRPAKINSLPANLTSFVGREQELREIDDLIQDPVCRLLSLVGPGGVGKTRLAIAAAERQLATFPNGACFVSLAGVTSVDSIIPTILQALQLQNSREGELKKQLLDYLQDKELVMVLDNFEHLVEGAGILNEILQNALKVTLLVTSRKRLGLQTEWLLEVGGLSYPSGMETNDLSRYEAVQLFTSRMKQVMPFQPVSEANLATIAQICRLVEGLPLALELAASAARMKSIEQILVSIESGKEDLSASCKDIPERHRSIRVVFEHSYRMLTEEEQRIFCGLGVFRGGFTAEAAEQVANATPMVIKSLVEFCLIRYNPKRERYGMHELVRMFAWAKLVGQGMDEELCHQHSAFFMNYLEQLTEEFEDARRTKTLKIIDEEQADIRLAWDWVCSKKDTAGLSKGWQSYCRYQYYRTHLRTGDQSCQAAIEMLDSISNPDPQILRIKAMLYFFQAAFKRDSGLIDEHENLRILEKSRQILTCLQQSGEDVKQEIAYVLKDIGFTIWTTEPEKTMQLFLQSLALFGQAGNKKFELITKNILANFNFWLGNFEEAMYYCRSTIPESRKVGDPAQISFSLRNLSTFAAHYGDLELALSTARENVEFLNKQDDSDSNIEGLMGLALANYYSSNWVEADKIYIESMSYIQKLEDQASLSNIYANWGLVRLQSGHYEAARVMADISAELSKKNHYTYETMICCYIQGGISLAQGQFDNANFFLKKSALDCDHYRINFMKGQVVGTWSIALLRSGDLTQGQQKLMEALETGNGLHSYTNLSFTVPAVALLLAMDGQVERALELCGLIDERSMLRNSPWFEDVVGRKIKEMAKNLQPKVAEAAYERGRQMDLFDTAARLLEEFKQNPA